MFSSMTGYGRAQVEGVHHRIFVEARSLNSRFLDVSLRLPTGGWALEPMIRKSIQERFKRGRIEVYVRCEPLSPEAEPSVELQVGKARSYLKVLEELRTKMDVPGAVDLPLMASFRDLFSFQETSVEGEKVALEDGLREALDHLEAMRMREGEALSEDLSTRIQWMAAEQERIHAMAPQVMEAQIARWRERLKKLMGDHSLDPGRLEQEAAIWMDRLDVTEELVRLKSHIGQFKQMLKQGGGIGRKLEFLLQEMHREVNTLGTKMMDAEISHRAVEMKAQIERMRELIQNIE